MKIKTPVTVADNSPPDLIKHLQAVTDDIRSILKGGLSFADGQLPFQYREVNVVSGQPTILYIQKPYTTIGAIPVQSYGVNILSWSVNTQNGKLTITVNLSVQSAKIGFLMVGASV